MEFDPPLPCRDDTSISEPRVEATGAVSVGGSTGEAVNRLPRRRAIFAALVGVTGAVLIAAMALVLAADGLDGLELAILILFACTLPWLVVGFWNSLIGTIILFVDRGRFDRILPLITPEAAAPLASRVAIVVPICDEDPELVFVHLRAVMISLDATGSGDAFDVFVLSDSRNDVTARRERVLFEDWQAASRSVRRLHYRRRSDNAGFKAGNLRDFCDTAGADYDLMVVLDADSVMSGAAIVRLVRLMEANPRLGILQTLAVALPAPSAFARLFQFGMRHGMRAYTVGSAWWQGDAGPYWGHNAIIRLAPFIAHCRLPRLAGRPPLGGDILSHDQVEAVLMRRAGYDVRVLPVEDGSYEANPPTLPDFAKRDLRWCQGNLQYLRLLAMPGVRPLGRFQLLMAILMYTGSPCWLALMVLATVQSMAGPWAPITPPWTISLAGHPVAPATVGVALFVVIIVLSLAPKLFGLFYAGLDGRQRRAFGGGARLLLGAGCEMVFSCLLAPVISVAQTLFMAALVVRRPLRWRAQIRTGRVVTWREAARYLWPQTALGAGWFVLLVATRPELLPWAIPVIAGLLFAMPLAVVTSRPGLGARLARWKLCATPEELAPPAEVQAVCPWLQAEPSPRRRRRA